MRMASRELEEDPKPKTHLGYYNLNPFTSNRKNLPIRDGSKHEYQESND